MRLYGEHHVSNALAAAAVAHELGMSAEEIATALSEAGTLSRWRMEVTERAGRRDGRQRRLQREPRVHASRAARARRDGQPRARRTTWAVLGQMAELGDESLAEHDAVGRLAVRLNVSKLVAVGGREAVLAATGRQERGFVG